MKALLSFGKIAAQQQPIKRTTSSVIAINLFPRYWYAT